MYLPQSYFISVIFMFITMLCWGSWANMTKIDKRWRFELFYWDYAFGVLLTTIILALTLGSLGTSGMSFFKNLTTMNFTHLLNAIISGAIFNIANILLVAAITLAGMAVAFPIGIGIALVIGTVLSYYVSPVGSPLFILLGVVLILAAVILDAIAYKRATKKLSVTTKGIVLSVISGILMSLFYPLIAKSMFGFNGLTPYNAVFFFAIGLNLCNLIVLPIIMKKPLIGLPVSFKEYRIASPKQHLIGLIGGIIWCVGMSFNLIASTRAGPAIAYAFGQGATLIAAIWGVFIWREFKHAKHVNRFLIAMFACYLLGLFFIGIAKLI